MGGEARNGLGAWLSATMRSRDLSQAALARSLGVADAQLSRWRRGRVIPSVRHLQRLADVLDVPRVDLDRLAGYPVPDADGIDRDPMREAELQAHQARFRRTLERELPPALWPAYLAACEALAAGLVGSFAGALDAAAGATDHQGVAGAGPGIGFRTRSRREDDAEGR